MNDLTAIHQLFKNKVKISFCSSPEFEEVYISGYAKLIQTEKSDLIMVSEDPEGVFWLALIPMNSVYYIERETSRIMKESSEKQPRHPIGAQVRLQRNSAGARPPLNYPNAKVPSAEMDPDNPILTTKLTAQTVQNQLDDDHLLQRGGLNALPKEIADSEI